MKTPRELLLARHRAVESKLDLARQRAVAGLSGALQEQNAGRLFAELVGSLKERDADAPRFVPRPRSDRQSEPGIA